MSTEIKEKDRKETYKRKVKRRSRLDLLFGCFKGQIFCDDAVFNLGVRQ